MSADQNTSNNAPQMPNYFELFQNILSPFTAGADNMSQGLASNATAALKASIDPKEIAKKMREMEVVLMWLKAQVGVVELSIKTLEYQLSLVEQFSKAKEAIASHTSATRSRASGERPSTGAGLGGGDASEKSAERDSGGLANAIPSLEELTKMASEMNPAAWAMKMIQEATSGKPAGELKPKPKATAKPANKTNAKPAATPKAKQNRKR